VGKTTVALAAVRGQHSLPWAEPAFVDLASVDAPDAVAAAFAVATLVAQILGATNITVLATSRTPLGIPGEALCPIEPLDAEAAADLFSQRARDANPTWVPTPANSDEVRQICAQLDGQPLALELAAARRSESRTGRSVPVRAQTRGHAEPIRSNEGATARGPVRISLKGRERPVARVAARHGARPRVSPGAWKGSRRLNALRGPSLRAACRQECATASPAVSRSGTPVHWRPR
jgi:hypothetical protein